MRSAWPLTALMLAVSGSAPVFAQQLHLDGFLVSVSDRATGVLAPSPGARGFGGGIGGTALWGRFALEASALSAKVTRTIEGSLATDSLGNPVLEQDAWTVQQLTVRARVRVISTLSAEVSATGRALEPDFDGEEVGFFGLGLYGAVPLSRQAGVWGRLAYLTGSRFTGTGRSDFGAEVQVGFRLALVGDRLHAAAQYAFQRIDRKVFQPSGPVTTPLEFDMLQLGLSYVIGRR